MWKLQRKSPHLKKLSSSSNTIENCSAWFQIPHFQLNSNQTEQIWFSNFFLPHFPNSIWTRLKIFHFKNSPLSSWDRRDFEIKTKSNYFLPVNRLPLIKWRGASVQLVELWRTKRYLKCEFINILKYTWVYESYSNTC